MSRPRAEAPNSDELLPALGTVLSLSVPGGAATPHLVLDATAGNRFRGEVVLGGLGRGPVLSDAARGTFVAVAYTLPDGASRAAVRRVVHVERDRSRLRLRWAGPAVADLRSHPRVSLDAPAALVVHTSPATTLSGTLVDISVGGCRIRVEPGTLDGLEAGLPMSLTADTALGPLVATAEVRSASADSLGVRFVQLDANTARWVADLDDRGSDTEASSPLEPGGVVWIGDGTSSAGQSWPARALPPASDGCPRFELLADEHTTQAIAPMQPVLAVVGEGNAVRRVRGRTTYGTHGVEIIVGQAEHEVLPVHRLPRAVPGDLWLAGPTTWVGGRVAIVGVGPLAIDVAGISLAEPRLASLTFETSVGLAAVLVHVPVTARGASCRLAVIDPHRQLLLSGDDAAPASWWLPVWLCEQLLAAHESRRTEAPSASR